jgi:hypothetical protein
LTRLCGIEAVRDVGERLSRQFPGLVGRQHPIAAERQAAAAAMGVAVLNEKGLRAARLHPNVEAEKLVIPNDRFSTIWAERSSTLRLLSFAMIVRSVRSRVSNG